MKITTATLFGLGMLLINPLKSVAIDVEGMSAAIVYLHQESPVSQEIDGVKYEVWLKVPGKTNEFTPMPPTVQYGSGILIEKEHHPYIVTAEHVARFMSPTSFVTFLGPNDTPISIRLSELADPTTAFHWINHGEADVSVLPVFAKTAIAKQLLSRHYFPANFLATDTAAPNRESNLTVLGFPLQLGTSGRFSPISKVSRPASGMLTMNRADNRRTTIFFLLQDPSIGGFSGGPVMDLEMLRVRGGNISFGPEEPRCYGLIHGTISDDSGGKMSAVTPAIKIIETIDKAEDSVWGKVVDPK